MTTTAPAGPLRPLVPSRYRLLAMLFITVVINYLDRNNLSIAAPALSRHLNLDPTQLGFLLSAFGWAYATMQIPGGWLVDRVSPRLLYALICGLWSLSTLLQGFAGTFLVLFSLRLLVGAFEAPAYPLCNRLITTWFPGNERAGAIAGYTSGQFVGLAFLTPLLAVAQKKLGWQSVFFLTGAAGLLWAVFWYVIYRDPSPAQRAAASAPTTPRPTAKFQWSDLAITLSRRKLWGIYLGQYAVTSTLWFFLTWFPTYLVDYRHLDFIKAGFLASLPFLAAFCGILTSGAVSDALMRRDVSATTARKVPVITGLLLSTSIIGANYVDKPGWIITFMAIAFFGNGAASIAWIFVSSLAPERLMGLTGGVFNFFGSLSAITTPIIIGHLVRENNFAPALVYVGAVALLGALSYIFVVGRVERVES